MRRAVSVLSLCLIVATGTVTAQQSGPFVPGRAQHSILVIDFEAVFDQSAFGRRINAEIEREGRAIAAQNRQIEAELIEEERQLTELRPTLVPDEFRKLANDFDVKVQRLRSEQDAKARAIGTRTEEARRRFLIVAQPVLESLVRDAGADLILERRTVFFAVDSIDVTDRAVALINREIGDGRDTDPVEPAPVPEVPPSPEP